MEFDNPGRFFRARLIPPFADCIHSGVSQNGVPANQLGVFDYTGLVDRDLDLYYSRDIHAARQFGIDGRNFAFQLASDLLGFLRPGNRTTFSGASQDQQETHREPMS
jgi:hypothetical protein